jgi:hypothetical protein
MPESKVYAGGCHCGRVSYEVTTDLAQVMECNCSICRKRGALWAFMPAEQFVLRAGADALADYQFGKKRLHHPFCPSCGVGSFSRGAGQDGREMIAVNVRCLEEVDLGSLKRLPFDGKSL